MDDAAAAREFERHRLQVYRWALRMLGGHDDAMDVTQDVSLRWLIQCRRTQPDHAQSWLRRVTINRATDRVRQKASSPPLAERDPEMLAADRSDDLVEQHELRVRLATAMEQLSDMQRQVLVAHVWDGLTFARIAADLGIAVPTAKTHYIRALSAVKEQMRDWMDDKTAR